MNRWQIRAIGTLLILAAPGVLTGCGTASATSTGQSQNSGPQATVQAPTPVPPAQDQSPVPPAAQPATGASVVPEAATPDTLAVPQARYLITAEALKSDLTSRSLRIVDLGEPNEYAAGHIPGAVHFEWNELIVTDTSPASIAAWQQKMADLLGSRGIGAQDHVVIYDHGTLWGARLWWVLDQLGHADKQILDGGFAAWQAAGGAVSKDPPTYAATTYVAAPQPAVLATEAQVRLDLGQPSIRLVDARSPGEYSGTTASGTAHAGHIPGAVNVPYNTTASGAQFKSASDLQALFAAQGVTPDQQVVTYCSTGVRGAVDYFALHLAGFANVQVYTGSWNEWGNDPTAPVAK